MDIETIRGWVEQMGYATANENPSTLRIRPQGDDDPKLPPFFIQCTENWILLSILPALGPRDKLPEELAQKLLFANRDMRVAKFALGKSDDVILCAELPTESLDQSELTDAVQRMAGYCRHYQLCLLTL